MNSATKLQGSDRFRIERAIADTLQGKVYVARDVITNKHVVIKEASRQLVHSGHSRNGYCIPEDFLNERKLIMMLSNLSDCPQSLIKGIDEWEDENYYCYAMEYCECELFDYISKHHTQTAFRKFITQEASKQQIPMQKPNEWVQNVANIFYQICQSVHWLHEKGYCHLDISLENTMISDVENLKVKIIDLGLTRKFNGNFNFSGRIGKTQYMCPEAYARQQYDAKAADVYCLGVMLFIMLIGAPPYQTPQPQNAAFNYCISGRIREVLKHWKRLRLITENALDLLNKIFRYQSKRITLVEILNHSFFADNVSCNVDECLDDGTDSDSSSDCPLISNDVMFKPSREYGPVSFIRYDSSISQSNDDQTTEIKEYCEIIRSLQQDNQRMKQMMEQQKQFIKALQLSNQGLIMTAQVSHQMSYDKLTNKNQKKIRNKKNRNKKKNKKRQIKTQQNQILTCIQNKPSYNPSPNRRARKYVNISKKMTQEIIPLAIGGNGAINWYKYMEKAIAMQLNDYMGNINEADMIVIDYDFCDELGSAHETKYYCIIEKHLATNDKTTFRWFMHEQLYSAKQVKILNCKIIIPQSSRAKLRSEINNIDIIKNVFSQKYEQIMNIKWWNITVFKRNNNKHRMVLRMEYQYMTRIIVDCLMQCDMSEIRLIPIIMFNNCHHWIEWIWIVRIYENVDIGISFIYNANGNVLKVTGVHLDRELIKEQHMLALPHHMYKCPCFEHWISNISDIEICADLNNNENKIKAYQQKYQSLKSFIYEFVDDHQFESSINGNYQLLKQRARSLIKYDNGSLNM